MSDLFVLSRFQDAWWDKNLVKNFHKYTVLLKNCVNVVSFSLWINTIQYFTKDWNSLILTLFDGKKKVFGLETFTLRSIIMQFAPQKLCPSSPLSLSLQVSINVFFNVIFLSKIKRIKWRASCAAIWKDKTKCQSLSVAL